MREEPVGETDADLWSDEDTRDLEELLLCHDALSIVEMVAILRRDHRDVRDKIAEIGRSCRERSEAHGGDLAPRSRHDHIDLPPAAGGQFCRSVPSRTTVVLAP